MFVAMFLKSRGNSSSRYKALPLDHCYAKTIVTENGATQFGLNILSHSIIVGEVARQLILLFPPHVQKSMFPKGTSLIAACHDIGKINPLFMKKLYSAVYGSNIKNFPELTDVNTELEKATGYHWGVSQAMFTTQFPTVATIVGRHHGTNPKMSILADDPVIGGKSWNEQRQALFVLLQQHFDEHFPEIDSLYKVTAIAGLVTVSDWIGSGNTFQNLQTIEVEAIPRLVSGAIKNAGFQSPVIKKKLSFEHIFGFSPYPSQKAFYDLVSQPGVYVLEALMGEGKTEAALYAAYKMLVQGENTGIYFALPTKLTSEHMHRRMQRFLKTILKHPEDQDALLLHGTAWLYSSELGEDADIGRSWFDAAKRKILAPFGVGTLDQALLSVLHVKHGFVRSFGLAGKVVILDEVHSYDAYTGTLLQYLITQLRELGCTVILLSATLTQQRKAELIGSSLSNTTLGYPLITANQNGQTIVVAPEGPPQRTCAVACSSDLEQTIEQIRLAALTGIQILWIENTVQEAQEIFKHFAAWGHEVGVEVGLLHARFSPNRRAELETHWVNLYGKEGKDKRMEQGRILVGTQVLEQSLDIDADLMVTRLAPSDMILQRCGRVWRHRQNDGLRPKDSRMSVIILVPNIDEPTFNPLYGFGPSGAVYDPYVLWRTYQEWKDKKHITISEDMREILERTYEHRLESGSIALAYQELVRKRENLLRYAFNSMSLSGETYDDDSAQTRYSDLTTSPVLLLAKDPKPQSPLRHLLDGSVIDLNVHSRKDRKKATMQIMKNLIYVPSYMAPDPLSVAELRWLKKFHYVSDEADTRIRVAVREESGTIRSLGGGSAHEEYALFYSDVLGYVAQKNMEEKW